VPQTNQQTPSEEYDSEEGKDYELPDVDLGQEEEEDEGAERDTSLPVLDTPLPNEETPLPEEYPPLPETPPPMPETPPQSEGMMTRAQARGGGVGGSEKHTCSEDIKTREKPSKTSAASSREHGAGGTGTARAATGSQEHGAGSRTTSTGR
jgi:hypothetical protein